MAKREGHPNAITVDTPDGPRRIIKFPNDPDERERGLQEHRKQMLHDVAEWKFEIKLDEKLEKAGYKVGKGYGMNSWWVEYPNGGFTIGWIHPENAIQACQDHSSKNKNDK